jgi:hypothetical protein
MFHYTDIRQKKNKQTRKTKQKQNKQKNKTKDKRLVQEAFVRTDFHSDCSI